MGKRLLLRSRINLLFSAGYLFLLSLELLSFTPIIWLQDQQFFWKLLAFYPLVLLLQKFPKLRLVTLLLVASYVFLAYKSQPVEIKNANQKTIIIQPEDLKIKDDWFSAVAKIDGHPVLVAGKYEKFPQDQEIHLKVNEADCAKVDGPTNFGQTDYRSYYLSKNIKSKITLKSYQVTWKKPTWIHAIRLFFIKLCQKLPKNLGFFTSELLLARSDDEGKDILNNYQSLGVIHLLSISGQHVALYALVISTICYSLFITEEKTLFICSGILLFNAILASFQAGFVRASLSYFLGHALKLKRFRLNSWDLLVLTLVIHLFLKPNLMLNLGAQLSYLAAFGLKLVANTHGLKQSFCINILLLPLLLQTFYQLNVLTLFFNLLIVPYFEMLVMPLVYLNLACLVVHVNLVGIFEKILNTTESWVNFLAHNSCLALAFGKINWLWTIILILLSCFYIEKLNRQKFFVHKRLLLIYVVIFLSIHFPLTGQVTFIDVGQGDSILITTPIFRKVYLIDVGGKVSFTGKKTTPQIYYLTLPALRAMGISKIDAVFLSHQDADHIGDLRPLLQSIPVEKMYVGAGLPDNQSFQKRIRGVFNKPLIECLAGDHAGPFDVVSPFQKGLGKNEDSLCLRGTFGTKSWLFTGDLPKEGELEIIKYFNLKVDYFKLGHHGSKTSSDKTFLETISPRQVFISAGRHNRYGHPNQETLDTLKELGIPWE
ncbi:MAG: DNA internalization-related competence protein ComEC/Rec2 [Lactobacillus sp.]|nr:DNA internalization-related competence protein ComEC/Rec2 [Lactobacillus sp.]